MIFTVVDVVATILEGILSTVDGLNSYWELSLVFRCLTDAIMLDDLATELRGMRADQRLPGHVYGNSLQEDLKVKSNTVLKSHGREIQLPVLLRPGLMTSTTLMSLRIFVDWLDSSMTLTRHSGL